MKYFKNILSLLGVILLVIGLNTRAFAQKDIEDRLIQQLNELEIKRNQFETESQLAIEQALKKIDRNLTPRAWLHAFTLSDNVDDRESFFKNVDHAIQQAIDWQDFALVFRLVVWKVGYLQNQGVPEHEVRQAFGKFEAFCPEDTSSVWCGRLYVAWSYYYYSSHDKALALKQSKKAIALLQRVTGPDAFYLHDAQTDLSNVLSANMQTLDQAIKLSMENFEWYNQHNYHTSAAKEASNLVVYFGDKQDENYLIDGLQWADRAEFHIKASGSDHLGHINFARSNLMIKAGRYAEAVNYAKIARDLFILKNVTNFVALSEILMARVLIKLPNLNEAEAALDRAEKLVPETFKYQHLSILELRVNIAAARGEMDKAFKLHREFHKKWQDKKEEDAKDGLTRLSAELGLKLEEQRNANLRQENELQKQKIREAEVIRSFVIVLSILSICTFGFLIYAFQQRRLLKKHKEVANLQIRLKDEHEARNAIAAKAAHHLNNPLQALSGLTQNIDAEIKNIWNKFQTMFPKSEDRTAEVQKVFESFRKSFRLVEDDASIMMKSLKRVATITNELRVLSGVHGLGMQRTKLSDFWKHLANEIAEDELLLDRSIKVLEFFDAELEQELWVEPITFSRSIFYLLKETLQSFPMNSSCEISMDLVVGEMGRSTATIHVISSGRLESRHEASELTFCQHLLARYNIAIAMEQDQQRLMLRISLPNTPSANQNDGSRICA